MHKSKTGALSDSWIMFKRCLLISLRNPEALLTATVVPFLLMLLFGTVFGNIADTGSFRYIDFIVPGIILQSISQCAQYSAINVTTDMTKGIIDRFRTMSVSKFAVLTGHAGAGMVRNAISTVTILVTAFFLGFRPQGGVVNWFSTIVLLLFVNMAFSLVGVLCGLISKTAEGCAALMLPLFILPFMSSGFVPVDSMPSGIRWFARIQPMTPISDSLRALTLDLPLDGNLRTSLIWCVALILGAFLLSAQIYKRKLS